jgi:hypothetical protein
MVTGRFGGFFLLDSRTLNKISKASALLLWTSIAIGNYLDRFGSEFQTPLKMKDTVQNKSFKMCSEV